MTIKKALPTPKRKTATQVQKEFDAFKQLVIEVTMDYDAGCTNGKIDFLDELGLEAPKQMASYCVSLQIPLNYQDDNDAEVALRDALKGSDIKIQSYSMEFIEWS